MRDITKEDRDKIKSNITQLVFTLREEASKNNISTSQLIKMIGCGVSTFSSWLTGAIPSASSYIIMCAILNIMNEKNKEKNSDIDKIINYYELIDVEKE